tara:strand:- start:163 stop:504 length:342 start_codon:yes stop_codon:yes gene_type:complete
MTNPTQTNRPVVKATNPELYVQHTFHMQKARKYTYNYSSLDDYIVENWDTKSIQQIADETNEYFNRVVYRVQLLQSLKLLKTKRNMERGKLMRARKYLIKTLKDIDSKLEGVA